MLIKYWPPGYPLCAICTYVMYFDPIDSDTIDLKTEIKRIAYCVNEKCSQYEKRIRMVAIEVEQEDGKAFRTT